MSRPPRSTSVDDTLDEPLPGSLDGESDDAFDAESGGPVRIAPDLAALPIVGLTRRRVAALIGVLLAVWIVMLFARQVGEAQAATTTAERLAIENQAQQLQAAALERELELIGRQRYIEQQARGYGLGSSREIAFTLDPDAPEVPDDAPGSAALRVGAPRDDVSPLERWLTVLFGPTD
jgi:cell division protein FtsB